MSLDAVWEFAGNYHPFLVHFPIALVFLAVVAEVLLVVKKEDPVSVEHPHWAVVRDELLIWAGWNGAV